MKEDSPALPVADSGPAFPTTSEPFYQGFSGLSAREYAAIHLRQPDSGVEWLDAMIRKAKRDEIAEKVCPELVRASIEETVDDFSPDRVASDSYLFADALLAEAEKGDV